MSWINLIEGELDRWGSWYLPTICWIMYVEIIVECNMFFLANSILQFGLQCNCIWRSISTWWGQIKPPMTDHGWTTTENHMRWDVGNCPYVSPMLSMLRREPPVRIILHIAETPFIPRYCRRGGITVSKRSGWTHCTTGHSRVCHRRRGLGEAFVKQKLVCWHCT